MNPKTTPVNNPSAKKPPGIIFSNLFTFIAGVLAIVALTITLYLWQQTSSKSGEYRKQIKELRTSLLQTLSNQSQQQRQAITKLQININQVLEKHYNIEKLRALSRTAYLLYLANLHLTIGHDIKKSVSLLQQAAQLLEKLDDHSLFTLKNALTQDIAKLEAIPQLDIYSIIIRLDTLTQQIQQLSIEPKQFISQQNDTPTKLDKIDAEKMPWYKKVLYSLRSLIKDLFIIRRTQQPVTPLFSPQQQVFLRENIQAKILQAEWAVLNQNPKLYQASLKLAAQWVQQLSQTTPQITDILKKINDLRDINIKPTLPNLSSSLNALDQSVNNLTPKSTDKNIEPKVANPGVAI